MRGPDMAPQTPQTPRRSGRHGGAVAPLERRSARAPDMPTNLANARRAPAELWRASIPLIHHAYAATGLGARRADDEDEQHEHDADNQHQDVDLSGAERDVAGVDHPSGMPPLLRRRRDVDGHDG